MQKLAPKRLIDSINIHIPMNNTLSGLASHINA